MGSTQFIPVELPNIELGNFVAESDKAFAKLQRDFVAFVEEHKVSSSAKLAMNVKISYDNLKKAYAITTNIDPQMPKKPSGVTTAFVSQDTEGKNALFTQSAGTKKGNPRQAQLQTADGETVN